MQTTESIISLYLILELLCSALKIVSSFVCVSSQPCCYSPQILGYMLERILQVRDTACWDILEDKVLNVAPFFNSSVFPSQHSKEEGNVEITSPKA